MAEKKSRYVPSLRVIETASASLPQASHFRGDTYSVGVDDGHTIEFRKIRFKTREGKNDRWVYDGKVIVQ